MARIEHVALGCEVYAQHFGAQVGPLYENAAKGFGQLPGADGG